MQKIYDTTQQNCFSQEDLIIYFGLNTNLWLSRGSISKLGKTAYMLSNLVNKMPGVNYLIYNQK